MKRFIFVEFTDPRVRQFLVDLRSALQRAHSPDPVHITVRGPYIEAPEMNVIAPLAEKLQGNGVVIGGAGMFQTLKGYSVYLRAQSPVLKDIWWKPDYPEGAVGLNPHITLFETKKRRSAREVENFLRAEQIEIFTFGIQLTVYTSKQLNLFEVNMDSETKHRRAEWGNWKVRPGIIHRARELRESLQDES